MNEYYAVIRSTDHLAHYGIRGMKWGVRKAIKHGNKKAYSRQYRKAQKKLAKLDKAADIENQIAAAQKRKRRAKVILNAGLIGIGAATGNKYLAIQLAKKASLYQKGRAVSAKYKTTNKGHAKAIAKRDAFQKEMNMLFDEKKYKKNMR